MKKQRWTAMAGAFAVASLGAGQAAYAENFVVPYDVDADTALYYLFNEEVGSYSQDGDDHFVVDEAGNQNLRTLFGEPEYSPFLGVEGPPNLGRAASTGGSSSERRRLWKTGFDAASTLNTSTFTIEAWIRNPVANNAIFSIRERGGDSGELQFRVQGDDRPEGTLRLYDGSSWHDSQVTHEWVEDVWYHVAMTYDHGDVDFYMTPETEVRPDGNADLLASVSGVPSFNFSDDTGIEIGTRWPGSGAIFRGDIALFRYSNTVRDSFNLVVPEPGSLALLGAGAGLMLIRRRRS